MGRKKKIITPEKENEVIESQTPETVLQESENQSGTENVSDDERFITPEENQNGWGENKDSHENDLEEIEKIVDQYKSNPEKKERKKRTPKEPEPVAFVIPPRLFISIHSELGANVVAWIDAKKSKNPIPAAYLGIKKESQEDLIPAAQECIKAMNLSGNPIAVFYGSLAACFIAQYIGIKAQMEQVIKAGGTVSFNGTDENKKE